MPRMTAGMTVRLIRSWNVDRTAPAGETSTMIRVRPPSASW
jgi:hypothetical protein